MTHQRILLCLSFACLTACGDGEAASPDAGAPMPDGGDASTAAGATLSGVAIKHSLNRLADGMTGRSPEYNNLSVEVVSVDALAQSATAPALVAGALDTSACPAMGGCAWSLSPATFTVTPPAGQTLTWDSTRVMVVIPNAVYFAPMYAR